MNRRAIIFSLLVLLAAALASCSSTKKLAEGEYELKKNKVTITNSHKYPKSDLAAYIKQSEKGAKRMGLKLFSREPVVLNDALIASSCTGMIRHLEYKGYYNSKVDTVVTRNHKKKRAKVNYIVTLGKQYPIRDLKYVVDDQAIAKIFKEDSARRTIRLGLPLAEESLEKEAERIAGLLRGRGYYGFTKNYMFNIADTTSVPDSTALRIELRDYTRNESPSMAQPHSKYRIRNVNYDLGRGLSVKPSFLEETNLIESGMLYSEDLVSTTYQRFAGNHIFNTVNVSLSPVDSTDQIDCTIALTPSKLQNFEVNMDISTNSAGLVGIAPSLLYNHFNIFHGGEVLSLGFRGNFQFKFYDPARSNEFAISAGLTFPKLLFLPFIKSRTSSLPATEVALVYNYQNRPEYTRNILSGSYGYSWSASPRMRFSINIPHLSVIKIFNIDQEFYQSLNSSYLQYQYQDHFDLGSTASFYYTTIPQVNPSVSYFYVRADLASSGAVLDLAKGLWQENRRGQYLIWGIPYSQYLRAQVSTVETLRFGRENQMALAARFLAGVGYAYGNSFFMPMEQMFYAGGANSMRGWQSRTIGPGNAPLDNTFAIYNQVGDMRLEANLELRFPLFWKLNGALFTDVGNIWNLPKKTGFMDDDYMLSVFSFDNLLKSTAMSWGVGARLDFGLLLVRVDLGIKGYDPASQRWLKPAEWFGRNGYTVHLGIGYPF